MASPLSIFLDFNLPNGTTWFYFSFLLAVALFFKFSRLVSVRNLDIVMIFVLVPGLLVVQAARPQHVAVERQPAAQIASLVGQAAMTDHAGVMAARLAHLSQQSGAALESPYWLWLGYLWLQLGSIYFFCRCLVDLALVQRPALAPNLQMGGLGWLMGALLICMIAVAYRQVERQLSPTPLTPPGGGPMFEIPDQPIFAIAVLWHGWPAWAVAALAFACHLAVLIALVLIGWRHFQDLPGGMAAATFYLLLPYTGLHVGQIHHVLPMALFLGAVLAYRYPILAGCILGLASATTYFPILVLPIWLGFYRGAGMGRFLIAYLVVLALGLTNLVMTLSMTNELDQSIEWAMRYSAWHPWRIPDPDSFSTESFWIGVHWAYRIPVFLLFVAFVVTTMFWPTPKNLAHVLALSSAVFIGMQWWCADQGGAYVLWYLPLFLLMVFRPNLHDRVPPPIQPESDWLTRSRDWTLRFVRRLWKRPEPAVPEPTSTGKAA